MLVRVAVVVLTASCRLNFDYIDEDTTDSPLVDGAEADTMPSGVDGPAGAPGCGLRALAVGATDSCAIEADGVVRCWGRIGGVNATSVDVGGPAVAVAMNHDTACVLRDDHKIRCVGGGTNGSLGDGSGGGATVPVAIDGDRDYQSLAASRQSFCAVTMAGGLECWGSARDGTLGNGMSAGDFSTPQPIVVAGAAFTRVFGGRFGSCADTTDGRRFCWGASNLSAPLAVSLTPEETSIRDEAVIGTQRACFLRAGELFCRGAANYGELGTGVWAATDWMPTVPIMRAQAVSLGGRASCAIDEANEVACWGFGRSGEVGTGDLHVHAAPTRIGIGGADKVATAHTHSCAETTTGVYCWGSDRFGQLGRGRKDFVTGVGIAGLGGGIAEVATSGDFGCARTTAGTVWCWGQNVSGQVGDASLETFATSVQVPLTITAKQLFSTRSSTCAADDSDVYCWGGNDHGVLGSSGGGYSATPVRVVGLPSGATLGTGTAGGYNACIIANGDAYCWGAIRDWGNDVLNDVPPTLQPDLPPLSMITAPTKFSTEHACAVATDGRAFCWGNNTAQQLGVGSTAAFEATPAAVTTTLRFTDIHVGYDTTCGITTTGSIACWGGSDGPTPVELGLTNSAISIEGDWRSMCVLRADGRRLCRGDNFNGEFGNGAQNQAPTFTLIDSVATQFSINAVASCFVAGGVVTCYGREQHGAFGARPEGAIPRRVTGVCE